MIIGVDGNIVFLSKIPKEFKDSTFTIGRIEAGTISMFTDRIDGDMLELVITPVSFENFEYWEDATAYDIISYDGSKVEIKLHKSGAIDVEAIEEVQEEVVVAVPEYTDEHCALAIYLDIDLDDEDAMSAIAFVNKVHEISVFTHGRKRYNVCSDSINMPTDCTVEFNGFNWQITTKYLLKITNVRTPAAMKNGHWKSYVGGIFEYSGNAHVGVDVHCYGEDVGIFHFYLTYIK